VAVISFAEKFFTCIMTVDFNIAILKELLNQNGGEENIPFEKFPKIKEWSTGQETPTYNQLVDLAQHYNIPFGYFFLDELPVKKYPLPHYRTFSTSPFKPSNELLYTIETLKQRQEWARDTLMDYKKPLPFGNSITIKTNIEDAAERVRNVLKLTANWAMTENLKDWKDAFGLLINRTEAAGIFVVVNGVVGNNTHARLNIKEFRGFVLYDKYAPFIFINNNDFITGKIFTIIHEIVHVLIGKSASFDFTDLTPAQNAIEEFCNSVSAEFLVPKNLLLQEFYNIGNDYEALARRFKVSRIVIARRLLDINKITKTEFNSAYNTFRLSQSETPAKGNGGDFYNTSPYRISRQFFKLVYNSVKLNRMLYREAFRLTGLKPGSFDGYVKEYFYSP
jgi:Zn-dependent peptidase ImmA (M78 family)